MARLLPALLRGQEITLYLALSLPLAVGVVVAFCLHLRQIKPVALVALVVVRMTAVLPLVLEIPRVFHHRKDQMEALVLAAIHQEQAVVVVVPLLLVGVQLLLLLVTAVLAQHHLFLAHR
jgi:hypothetical protein